VPTRRSGYEVVSGETYITPRWVYDALWKNVPDFYGTPDPCPENPKVSYYDMVPGCGVFSTNPPFTKAHDMIAWALETRVPKFAFLLPATWDCAASRKSLFSDPMFGGKLVLTRRIRWENLEQKKNGPSSNHAWYIWGVHRDGPWMKVI
jgi:hypothetical protein